MKEVLDQVIADVGRVILGKENTLRLALTCLMVRGHLLIEDRPGVGKTTLAHALARALGLNFQRIQFTSDLLPADILGVSIYDRNLSEFRFCPGPIFAQLILADEVNRSTPKTQSALLEAMEEHQVTIEGETHILPAPFFVIATQNPTEQVGTYPLPESQLDRFTMRLEMGYPDHQAERTLLQGRDGRQQLAVMRPSISAAQLLQIQEAVSGIHVSEALLDYLQALLGFSREAPYYHTGLSPRAGLAVRRCAQAWALMHGRDHVVPEDVQAVLPSVINHRLKPALEYSELPHAEIVGHMITVAIP